MSKTIRCVAIVTVDCNGFLASSQGKKRNVECGKRMVQVGEFTWKCTSGHVRKWPFESWTALSMGEFSWIGKEAGR